MNSNISHNNLSGNAVSGPRNVPSVTIVDTPKSKWLDLPKVSPLKWDKGNFTVGCIIRALLHEEDFKDGLTATDLGPNHDGSFKSQALNQSKEDVDICQSAHGFIHTKVRLMIVIAKYDYYYWSVPLYTHNGKGLEGKKPDDFIYVHDRRNPKKAPVHPRENIKKDYAALLADPSGPMLHPLSAVHFANVVSRKYKFPIVAEGRLTDKSTKTLLLLLRSTVVAHFKQEA